jgi:DNA primase
MSYPREWLDQLNRSVDLVALVSQFTAVRKFGSNYLALCPFHPDKDPSMQVNPHNNTFYCHACGAGSKNHSTVKRPDPISFLMNAGHLNFDDAVKTLAQMCGMTLPPQTPQEKEAAKKAELWTTYLEAANKRFQANLKENHQALNYLTDRGFSLTEIVQWQLGFGDDQNKELLNTVGRITFPIWDYDGHLVSFTGRLPYSSARIEMLKQAGKQVIKYKDRYRFNKGDHLYGLNLAKDYIRESHAAILTEGYTDVINLHKHQVNNVVSTMGTALTEAQIKLLKRAGADQVILMRDGDEAGLLAAERDEVKLRLHDLKCLIMPLPDHMDPDDFCNQYGLFDDNLHVYMQKHTQSIQQWKINRIYSETQDNILYHYDEINLAKSDRMERVIKVLQTVQDPIQLDLFIRQIAELFCVSYETIKERVREREKNEQK